MYARKKIFLGVLWRDKLKNALPNVCRENYIIRKRGI